MRLGLKKHSKKGTIIGGGGKWFSGEGANDIKPEYTPLKFPTLLTFTYIKGHNNLIAYENVNFKIHMSTDSRKQSDLSDKELLLTIIDLDLSY